MIYVLVRSQSTYLVSKKTRFREPQSYLWDDFTIFFIFILELGLVGWVEESQLWKTQERRFRARFQYILQFRGLNLHSSGA